MIEVELYQTVAGKRSTPMIYVDTFQFPAVPRIGDYIVDSSQESYLITHVIWMPASKVTPIVKLIVEKIAVDIGA